MSLYHRILFTFLLIAFTGYADTLHGASLTLSWNDRSNNEDGFSIERMVSGGILTQIATVGANVTSYADANLTSGLNYCYIVRAFNSAGVSDATNVACAVAIHLRPEFFLARNGHIWLIALQLIAFAGYLSYVVIFYTKLAPMIAQARAEWRAKDPADETSS